MTNEAAEVYRLEDIMKYETYALYATDPRSETNPVESGNSPWGSLFCNALTWSNKRSHYTFCRIRLTLNCHLFSILAELRKHSNANLSGQLN